VWLLAVLVIAGVIAVVLLPTIPLTIAFLPGVAIVPWVGSARAPAMFVWSGPFVMMIWALFAVAVAQTISGLRAPTRVPWVVALVAAVLTAFAYGAWRSPVIGGDEPHYLLIAQSLVRDGDLDLTNDYDIGRHAAFYPGTLAHHTVVAFDGKEYSFHGIGAGVLAMPGFWIAGLTGARISFLLLCITGVVAVWMATRELAGASAAWAATSGLILQLPFLAQAAAIYPDGPAGAITAFALWTLIRLERGRELPVAWLLACAASLSMLPWLHIRLGLVADVIAIAVTWSLWQRGRWNDIFVFLALPIIAAALFFASSYVMFRTLDPTAAFRTAASGSIANVPAGAFGLLFDHEFGLLPYAPVFVFSFFGWRALHAKAPLVATVCAAVTLATLITGAAFVWWGGASSPARFLVPVLPALALSLGAWWNGASVRARSAAAALIACGAVLAAWAASVEHARYITNNADGRLTIFEWANTIFDISRSMPSLFRPDATLGVQAGVAIVWIASAMLAARVGRTWPVVWCVVVSVTLAAVAGSMIQGLDPTTSQRSQRTLLQASRSPWRSTTWLNRRPGASVNDVLQTLALEMPVAWPPPGRYRVEVTNVDPGADANGTLSLILGAGAHRVVAWPLSSPDQAPNITFPITIENVRVAQSSPAGETRVRLRPLSQIPVAAARERRANYAVHSRDSLLFVFDGPQDEESGFWVFADRPVAVVCTLVDGETPCGGLRLQAESDAVDVQISQGERTESLSLRAQEIVGVELEKSLSPVIIRATGAPPRAPAVFVTAAPLPAAR
jgi:hypothetical protein